MAGEQSAVMMLSRLQTASQDALRIKASLGKGQVLGPWRAWDRSNTSMNHNSTKASYVCYTRHAQAQFYFFSLTKMCSLEEVWSTLTRNLKQYPHTFPSESRKLNHDGSELFYLIHVSMVRCLPPGRYFLGQENFRSTSWFFALSGCQKLFISLEHE